MFILITNQTSQVHHVFDLNVCQQAALYERALPVSLSGLIYYGLLT